MVDSISSARTCPVDSLPNENPRSESVDDVSEEIRVISNTRISPDIFRSEDGRRFEALAACSQQDVFSFQRREYDLRSRLRSLPMREIESRVTILFRQAYRRGPEGMVVSDALAHRELRYWFALLTDMSRNDRAFLNRIKTPTLEALMLMDQDDLTPRHREMVSSLSESDAAQELQGEYIDDLHNPAPEVPENVTRRMVSYGIATSILSLFNSDRTSSIASSETTLKRWHDISRISSLSPRVDELKQKTTHYLLDRLTSIEETASSTADLVTQQACEREHVAVVCALGLRGIEADQALRQTRASLFMRQGYSEAEAKLKMDLLSLSPSVSPLERNEVRHRLLDQFREAYRELRFTRPEIRFDAEARRHQSFWYQTVFHSQEFGGPWATLQELDRIRDEVDREINPSCQPSVDVGDILERAWSGETIDVDVRQVRFSGVSHLGDALMADVLRKQARRIVILPAALFPYDHAAGTIAPLMGTILLKGEEITSPAVFEYLVTHELSHIDWSRTYYGRTEAAHLGRDERLAYLRGAKAGYEISNTLSSPDSVLAYYRQRDLDYVRRANQRLGLPIENLQEHAAHPEWSSWQAERFLFQPYEPLPQPQNTYETERRELRERQIEQTLIHRFLFKIPPTDREGTENLRRLFESLDRLQEGEISETYDAGHPLARIVNRYLGIPESERRAMTFSADSWRRTKNNIARAIRTDEEKSESVLREARHDLLGLFNLRESDPSSLYQVHLISEVISATVQDPRSRWNQTYEDEIYRMVGILDQMDIGDEIHLEPSHPLALLLRGYPDRYSESVSYGPMVFRSRAQWLQARERAIYEHVRRLPNQSSPVMNQARGSPGII